MSLIASHLEHINFCCEGIDSLSFDTPGIFTNALLSNTDITSLIRDTEAHERALFSVPPPPPHSSTVPPPNPDDVSNPSTTRRRQTVFNVSSGEVTTGPPTSSGRTLRKHTAVSAVLGGTLHHQITRRRPGEGEIDIEILLRGAEKLCTVYALPGAHDRINNLRSRHEQLQGTLAYYEAKVAEQNEALEGMKRDRWIDNDHNDHADEDDEEQEDQGSILTEDDLRREEDEVKEMDRQKKELQEQLRRMEKDLVGL